MRKHHEGAVLKRPDMEVVAVEAGAAGAVAGGNQGSEAGSLIVKKKPGTGGKVAAKAGAYGGSEVGALVGHAVGPPIIGGIVGNVLGERLGERGIKGTGLDTVAGNVHNDMSRVFGKERADKVGDIALTALGYSQREYCICCPCLPASQIMFLTMIFFFVFNCYRLSIGIHLEINCSSNFEELGENNKSLVLNVTQEEFQNGTIDYISVIREDNQTDTLSLLVSYPCQDGFHYLVSGAAVWISFLPFYIFTLFGNCWRQCCCCLCDPVVCVSTIFDFFKRCFCECGKFSCLDLIWYSMCIFQVVWACLALSWLFETLFDEYQDFRNYDSGEIFIPTVISAITMDLFFAGSEIVHKIRLFRVESKEREEEEQQQQQQLQEFENARIENARIENARIENARIENARRENARI